MPKRQGLPASTTEEGVDSLIKAIRGLMSDLNMSKSFKEEGIDEEEYMKKVDELAYKAFEDQCTTANPKLPLIEDLKQILIDAYYGEEK